MEIDHSARAHSVLSPSGSHRYLGEWPCYLGCTAAPGIEADLPDTTSVVAKEGTLCHEFCESKLRGWLENCSYRAELNRLRKDELYDKEMEECSDGYVEYIKDRCAEYEKMPTVLVEERLDITDYMPDCFGTGDCLIISEDTLHVVDYKHGKGVKVEAPHNPQLMLYALGAYKGWSLIHELKHIKFTIYQQRIDNIAEWECSVEELLNFGELVRAKVKEIENNPTFRPTEEGCRFCKARATCRARANHFLEIAGFTDKEPDLIDPSEVKAMIDKGSGIDKWLSDLKEWALKECLSGHEVPGLKAVHGRSNRVWSDQESAFKALKDNGYDEAVLYERKPITLSAAEKLVGKKDFESIVGRYISKPPGKPTLVDENDKREAVKPLDAKDIF
jgi:hypothetical protein